MNLNLHQIIKEWTDNQSFDDKIITLFNKVRDIPYGDIGSRNPLDVIKNNKGTCSGKHELLKAIYKELGFEVKDFIIIHKFNDLPVRFPENIRAILDKNQIVDPHNFFKIKRNDNWFVVDVTWDSNLEKLGFPVNKNWDGVSDMNISVALGGEIYETVKPLELKRDLIAKLPTEVQKDRTLFLKELTKWLDFERTKAEV
ncbi:hypothetical protein [Lutibacter sp. B1]|uniref:hypothetical protein n=1 Tax=Lutibacter sp. B1 TaxID=2725996 RepID=UPI001456AFE3|nr:hypothetical protein [Lutibacter sp. B1]NLP57242.1 hypothetical protein [Lutibacter sp. B1]